MTYDPNDPNVVAHRLSVLEGALREHINEQKDRVEALDEKIDGLAELLRKNLCPAPGSCVPLTDAMKRLEGVVGLHEEQLQRLRISQATTEAATKASVRTTLYIASAVATALGTVASISAQIFLR